jgi:ligand-binding SRPBCC domain-containing protein
MAGSTSRCRICFLCRSRKPSATHAAVAKTPNRKRKHYPTSRSAIHLCKGSRHRLKTPFRLKWQAEIVDFEWNSHFCDLQVRGPFKYWKHCHRLRSVEREGVNVTVITDQLEYELPFESLGVLGHRFLVRKQIERIFEYRHQQVFRIFTDRSNLHIPAA